MCAFRSCVNLNDWAIKFKTTLAIEFDKNESFLIDVNIIIIDFTAEKQNATNAVLFQ